MENSTQLATQIIESPEIAWTHLLGTSDYDGANALATDSEGGIYVAGVTYGNLDGQINSGNGDAFITKYQPDGSKAWTNLLGTSYHDFASALTTDNDGGIYLAGYTRSEGAVGNSFIIKYKPDGTMTWMQPLSIDINTEARSLAIGIDGAIYVAGHTGRELEEDAFITKYQPDGTEVWTQLLRSGGILRSSGIDAAHALTVGSDGAIYIAGESRFNKDAYNLYGITNGGAYDTFIAKYSPDGTIDWIDFPATGYPDWGGWTGFPGKRTLTTGIDGAIYLSSGSLPNASLIKYKPDGTKEYSINLDDEAFAMTTGNDGEIYLEGYLDFTKYQSDGTKDWIYPLETSKSYVTSALTTGIDGAIYMAGFAEGDLNGQNTNNGSRDAFIVKLIDDGTSIDDTTSPEIKSFIEDTNISLPNIIEGEIDWTGDTIAWTDYNGDGKPDFLLKQAILADRTTRLYKNTGSGFIEDTSVSLPDVIYSSIAWADYNSDGKPDFLLTGTSTSGPISKLYKNMGSGFIEDTNISLPGVDTSSVAWADYNGDGKPDLLLTGGKSSSDDRISKLYKNTGSTLIEDTSISLPGVDAGSVAWADYNSDGKPDFLLTGRSSSGLISKLYKNTGNSFIEDTSILLPGVNTGSVAWADYNSDGKPDFLLTGRSSSGLISKLYKNTGNSFIEDTSILLPGVNTGSVAWADYNSDGKPDFLLTGSMMTVNGETPISKLYKNTGSGFTEDTSISLPGVAVSAVGWADYTSDGKPDFLLTGASYDDYDGDYYVEGRGFVFVSKLYENTTTTSDTTAPNAITFTPYDNSTIVAVDANLTIDFSEPIKKGSGNIVIKKIADNSIVETIAVNNSNVIVNGSQIIINPNVNLIQNTEYYIEIANGAIQDIAGNNYAGITGNSTWNFTTNYVATLGADLIIGTAGPDTIDGLAGNDTIRGLAGNDRLIGGPGNDRIDGGAGDDTMIGGTGNDTYVVNSPRDRVIEALNAGTDTVLTTVTYTLPANVENLTLRGTRAINGTGNTLANRIVGNSVANRINGGGGNDTLIGGGGNDVLNGGAGNDILNGGPGNDRMDGGKGDDTMTGGTGNDTYVVDSVRDRVIEALNAGTDTVLTTVTYTLPANVENLTLRGTRAINGTGNTLANRIVGNSAANRINGGGGNDVLNGGAGNDILNGGPGNDILNGGAGDDTLIGGLGADRFLYNTNAAFIRASVGVDTITDFVISQNDKILLDKTTFNRIRSANGAGFSVGREFARVTSDAAAATSPAFIVYNTTNGSLFYNPNGATDGFGTGGKFAVFSNKPSLTANQFIIQA